MLICLKCGNIVFTNSENQDFCFECGTIKNFNEVRINKEA